MKVCFFNITSMANNNNRINNHHQNRFGCAQTLFHFTVILFRVWIWMALSLFLSILTLLFGFCVCASAHSICLTLYIKYSPLNNSRSRWIWIANSILPKSGTKIPTNKNQDDILWNANAHVPLFVRTAVPTSFSFLFSFELPLTHGNGRKYTFNLLGGNAWFQQFQLCSCCSWWKTKWNVFNS